MCSWNCLLKKLISFESLLIKTLMLTLRGLALGVPYSAHFLKLAMSSRAMSILYDKPLASLIGSLDRGGIV